jgi:hypothetical protein
MNLKDQEMIRNLRSGSNLSKKLLKIESRMEYFMNELKLTF